MDHKHTCCENNEEKLSDCSKSLSNSTDAILIDKVSLSSSNSLVVGSDVGPKPTSIEDSSINLDTTHLNVVENLSSVLNIEIPVIMKNSKDDETISTSFIENHASDPDSHVIIANYGGMENKISDSSLLKDETNKTGNIIEQNLNHEKWNSQDENARNVVSIPESGSKRKSSGTTHNAWRFKLLLIFVACCIIGCYLIPFAVYASQFRSNTSDDFSNDKNISSANITLMETCKFSNLSCTNQILHTYEALRTINLPSSQQYCTERVEALICDASIECNNESYVKDIVCQQVRQEYCTAEWRMLEVNNQSDGLIVCEEYEETAPLNCSDQFGLAENGSACLPLCEEFSLISNTELYAVCAVISIIGGLTVIVISIKKRKKMFIFPQILIVIAAGIVVINQCLLFIPAVSVGRWNILCSSKFLFDAHDNPTAFCTFQGTMFSSGIVVSTYLWTLYIVHLTIKLFFPIRSSKLFKSDHSRKIFIAEVAIVFIVGSVPSILIATVGPNYYIITYPPLYCGNDGVALLLVSVFPALITNFINHTLILLILYKLHIHGEGIFKSKHKGSAGKQVCTCQFTIPELKVIIVLFYTLLFTIVFWSFRSGTGDRFDKDLRKFTDCMAGGTRKEHDCRELRENLEDNATSVLEVSSLFFLAFQNFASLPFVIQFQTIKKSIKQTFFKFTTNSYSN